MMYIEVVYPPTFQEKNLSITSEAPVGAGGGNTLLSSLNFRQAFPDSRSLSFFVLENQSLFP